MTLLEIFLDICPDSEPLPGEAESAAEEQGEESTFVGFIESVAICETTAILGW